MAANGDAARLAFGIGFFHDAGQLSGCQRARNDAAALQDRLDGQHEAGDNQHSERNGESKRRPAVQPQHPCF